jgi:hypothetical protein
VLRMRFCGGQAGSAGDQKRSEKQPKSMRSHAASRAIRAPTGRESLRSSRGVFGDSMAPREPRRFSFSPSTREVKRLRTRLGSPGRWLCRRVRAAAKSRRLLHRATNQSARSA